MVEKRSCRETHAPRGLLPGCASDSWTAKSEVQGRGEEWLQTGLRRKCVPPESRQGAPSISLGLRLPGEKIRGLPAAFLPPPRNMGSKQAEGVAVFRAQQERDIALQFTLEFDFLGAFVRGLLQRVQWNSPCMSLILSRVCAWMRNAISAGTDAWRPRSAIPVRLNSGKLIPSEQLDTRFLHIDGRTFWSSATMYPVLCNLNGFRSGTPLALPHYESAPGRTAAPLDRSNTRTLGPTYANQP